MHTMEYQQPRYYIPSSSPSLSASPSGSPRESLIPLATTAGGHVDTPKRPRMQHRHSPEASLLLSLVHPHTLQVPVPPSLSRKVSSQKNGLVLVKDAPCMMSGRVEDQEECARRRAAEGEAIWLDGDEFGLAGTPQGSAPPSPALSGYSSTRSSSFSSVSSSTPLSDLANSPNKPLDLGLALDYFPRVPSHTPPGPPKLPGPKDLYPHATKSTPPPFFLPPPGLHLNPPSPVLSGYVSVSSHLEQMSLHPRRQL